MTRHLFLSACCWAASIVLATAGQVQPPPPIVPETNPHASPADVEAGRVLYAGRCGHCHGLGGEGGRGAVLNTGQFHHGETDRDLFLIVRNGIPNSEMPGSQNMPDADLWRLVGYVRQLSRQGAPEPVTGDAAAGTLVYQSHGCARCHTIGGQGGFMGPDLTDLGAKRSVRYVRESIVNPNADIPLEYRSVVVVTSAGTRIAGIHLNEDEYSIHLRDTNGLLRSFLKSELREITLTGQSLMPASSSLSKDELENLVAFLSSLRAKR